MVTTWTPPKTTEAKNPGTQLWEHVFGTSWSSDEAFVAIEQGLSAGVLRRLEACVPGVIPVVPELLGISPRTLARRRSQGRLTPVESDRLFRLGAVYPQAPDLLRRVAGRRVR